MAQFLPVSGPLQGGLTALDAIYAGGDRGRVNGKEFDYDPLATDDVAVVVDPISRVTRTYVFRIGSGRVTGFSPNSIVPLWQSSGVPYIGNGAWYLASIAGALLILYGTGAPPDASDYSEGTLYFQYEP